MCRAPAENNRVLFRRKLRAKRVAERVTGGARGSPATDAMGGVTEAEYARYKAAKAYPGYRKMRKRIEAQLRRTSTARMGWPTAQRSFVFVLRVCVAALLLPFDILTGNAMESGDYARPAMGVFGLSLAYGTFRYVTRGGPNGSTLQQRATPDLRRVHRPVEIPHWANPCNLEGLPGAVAVCPQHAEARGRKRLYVDVDEEAANDGGSASTHSPAVYEVHEAPDGQRVLTVDGEVYTSYDTRNGRVGHEHAREAVRIASNWERLTAGGATQTRVLVLGLGGGGMVSGIHHRCHARSRSRHRRGHDGQSGCVITAVENDPRVVRIARGLFLGKKEDDGVLPDDGNVHERVAFVERDAVEYVRVVAKPGAFDVVIDDVFDSRGKRPEDMKRRDFYADVHRRLGHGGKYVVVVPAPAWGPGRGWRDLATSVANMRAVFGKENVRVVKTGPYVPLFPQRQLVVGTKVVDQRLLDSKYG